MAPAILAQEFSGQEEGLPSVVPGFAEPIPTNPQDVDGWLSEKHLELRDPIDLGDKESILALTDLIQKGVVQCHNLPSTVDNMVVS